MLAKDDTSPPRRKKEKGIGHNRDVFLSSSQISVLLLFYIWAFLSNCTPVCISLFVKWTEIVYSEFN
jgi:hypothetical protein